MAMKLSVTGIQGLWAEKDTKNTWEGNGIVAEKTHRPRGQKKSPIVLSDGPDGVMWGKGNLMGNLEDGMLVWRNRRGEATYRWEKVSGKAEAMQAAKARATAAEKPRTAGRKYRARLRRCRQRRPAHPRRRSRRLRATASRRPPAGTASRS